MGKLRNTANICDYIVENANRCYDENIGDAERYVSCFKKFMAEIGLDGKNSISENVYKGLKSGKTEKYQYCRSLNSQNGKVAWVVLFMLGYISKEEEKNNLINELSTKSDIDLIEIAQYFGVKRFVEKNIDYKKSDIISVDGKEYEVINNFKKETRSFGCDELEVISYGDNENKIRYLNSYELDRSKLVKRGKGKTTIEIRQEIYDEETEKISAVMKVENIVKCDYVLTNMKEGSLNKNNSLEDYVVQCEKPQFDKDVWYDNDFHKSRNWYLRNVQICGEVHLTKEIYEIYTKNHLLDFLSIFEDESVNGGTTSFYEESERKDFVDRYGRISDSWYDYISSKSLTSGGLAVFVDGKLGFVVDAQGSTYARYVLLPSDDTLKIPTKDIYEKFGEKYEYKFDVNSEGYEKKEQPIEMISALQDDIIAKIETLLISKYGLKPIEANNISEKVADIVEDVVNSADDELKKSAEPKSKKSTKRQMKEIGYQEMIKTKSVKQIQTLANGNVYEHEGNEIWLKNHETARKIFDDYKSGILVIKDEGFFGVKDENKENLNKSADRGKPKTKASKKQPKSFNELDEISKGLVITEVLGNDKYEICDVEKEEFFEMTYDEIIEKFYK